MEVNNKYDDRFRRWQKTAIDYRTTVNTTVLAFDIAALGYTTSILKVRPEPISTIVASFYLVACVMLLMSAGCGLYMMLNRLKDFTDTAQINRNRMQGANDTMLAPDRVENNKTGQVTHRLLNYQIITFMIGIVITLIFEFGYIFLK